MLYLNIEINTLTKRKDKIILAVKLGTKFMNHDLAIT